MKYLGKGLLLFWKALFFLYFNVLGIHSFSRDEVISFFDKTYYWKTLVESNLLNSGTQHTVLFLQHLEKKNKNASMTSAYACRIIRCRTFCLENWLYAVRVDIFTSSIRSYSQQNLFLKQVTTILLYIGSSHCTFSVIDFAVFQNLLDWVCIFTAQCVFAYLYIGRHLHVIHFFSGINFKGKMITLYLCTDIYFGAKKYMSATFWIRFCSGALLLLWWAFSITF